MDPSTTVDSTSIFYEVYAYSKKNILKIKKNLDIIYGAFSEEKNSHINLLYEHTTHFFDKLVLESENDKNAIIKNIEELLAEKDILEKELDTHITIQDNKDDTPLITIQLNIETVLQDFRNIKLERMNEFDKLKEEEKKVCKMLNLKPVFTDFKGLPSKSHLIYIKQHFSDLKMYMIELFTTFMEQRTNVISMFNALGEVPILEFDIMVLDTPDEFQLSKSNMDKLLQLCKRLNKKVEKQKNEAVELRKKLYSLWNLLQIDDSYTVKFDSDKECYDKNVLSRLKKEVLRCEMLKGENCVQCIEHLREQLNDLWNKCYFGELQRKKCKVYFMAKSHNKEYNVYVMELLEIEVNCVKKFYTDNSTIYYLIEEWNHLWKKMIMIQEVANDPGRYWQNRGGQLLKEEKERKIIQKELPRVEKELKSLLEAYEQREGKSFLYNDERLINFIDKQWNEMKTNKKLLRQNKTNVNPRTPLSATPHSQKNIVSATRYQTCNTGELPTANKATLIPRRILFQQNNNEKQVQINSTPYKEVNLTSTPQFGRFNRNALVGSYNTFQKHQETKRRLFFTNQSGGDLREQGNEQPKILLMDTPIRSQIPILITSKNIPSTVAAPRTNTKLSLNMKKKH